MPKRIRRIAKKFNSPTVRAIQEGDFESFKKRLTDRKLRGLFHFNRGMMLPERCPNPESVFGKPLEKLQLPLIVLAILYGRDDMVELLLARGAKLAPKMPGGFTPLMIAAAVGASDELMEMLLDQQHFFREAFIPLNDEGFSPTFYVNLDDFPNYLNDTNEEGWSALAIAVANRHYAIAKKLQENGANLRQTNHHGYSVFELALMNALSEDVSEDDYLFVMRMLNSNCASLGTQADAGPRALELFERFSIFASERGEAGKFNEARSKLRGMALHHTFQHGVGQSFTDLLQACEPKDILVKTYRLAAAEEGLVRFEALIRKSSTFDDTLALILAQLAVDNAWAPVEKLVNMVGVTAINSQVEPLVGVFRILVMQDKVDALKRLSSLGLQFPRTLGDDFNQVSYAASHGGLDALQFSLVGVERETLAQFPPSVQHPLVSLTLRGAFLELSEFKEMVRVLVKGGCDHNVEFKGATPLIIACQRILTVPFRAFLEAGFDVNYETSQGLRAIDYIRVNPKLETAYLAWCVERLKAENQSLLERVNILESMVCEMRLGTPHPVSRRLSDVRDNLPVTETKMLSRPSVSPMTPSTPFVREPSTNQEDLTCYAPGPKHNPAKVPSPLSSPRSSLRFLGSPIATPKQEDGHGATAASTSDIDDALESTLSL